MTAREIALAGCTAIGATTGAGVSSIWADPQLTAREAVLGTVVVLAVGAVMVGLVLITTAWRASR